MKRKVLVLDNKEDTTHIIEEEVKNGNLEAEKKRFLAILSTSTEIGFSVSLPIAAGAIIGAYLDTMLGSSPKLTLSLLFSGVFIGGINIYRVIRDAEKDEQNKKNIK